MERERDPASAIERFQRLATHACAHLQGLPNPSGEAVQQAIVSASRATGFLEALSMLAPDAALEVAGDAERLEAAVSQLVGRRRPTLMP